MANPIMHFEIPADDIARAKAFYEKTFGWKIRRFRCRPVRRTSASRRRRKASPASTAAC